MSDKGTLQYCPTCQRPWPKHKDYDLRAFAWLDGLPRGISVSNLDAVIHDGANGRNRFLVLETKGASEHAQTGQEWLLKAVAGLPRFTVRVLRGTLDNLSYQRVSPSGIAAGIRTTPAAFRASVADFLNGFPWGDPFEKRNPERECPACHHQHPVGTTCGWDVAA